MDKKLTSLCRKLSWFWISLLFLTNLLPARPLRAQTSISSISIDLDVASQPILSNAKQFGFRVAYRWGSNDKLSQLQIRCTSGLKCYEKSKKVTMNLYEGDWTATLTRELNLAEIQVSVSDVTGGQIVRGLTVKGVDLGFSAREPRIASNLPETATAGDEQRLRLWFADKNGTTLKPTATVHMDLSSDNQCADFRYIPPGLPITSSSKYDFRGSVSIPEGHDQPDGDLFIQPHTWFTSVCKLDVYSTIAGTQELRHDPLTFRVEPAFLPAIVLCFCGVLTNFSAAGLFRIIKTAKDNRGLLQEQKKKLRRTLKEVFWGDQGEELFSVILKGCLAYGTCWLAISTEKLGIKVDTRTLAGFFTLGFMVGFWPLEKLWSFFGPSGEE